MDDLGVELKAHIDERHDDNSKATVLPLNQCVAARTIRPPEALTCVCVSLSVVYLCAPLCVSVCAAMPRVLPSPTRSWRSHPCRFLVVIVFPLSQLATLTENQPSPATIS